MKIRFLRGTTLASGKAANEGDVIDVSADDVRRFVHLFKDAVLHVEEPKEAPAQVDASPEVAPEAEAPAEESKKGKKKV